MDYQSLHIKTVAELRALAKTMGVRIPAGTNKSAMIKLLLDAYEAAEAAPKPKAEAQASAESAPKRRGRPPKKKAPEAAEPAKPEAAPEPKPEPPKSGEESEEVKAEAKEEAPKPEVKKDGNTCTYTW